MTQYLAMDFGGTFVKYALMDEDAVILYKDQVKAPLESTEAVVQTVGEIFARYRDCVAGVAISMPGVLDSDSGYAYSAGAYNLVLNKMNIFELLSPVIDKPMALENDAKAAVLAEAWKGALQGVNCGVAVILGSGVGGGIIMDGKLQKGGHFAAGELSGLLMQAGGYDRHFMSGFTSSTSSLLRMVAEARGMRPAQFEISGFMNDEKPDPNLPVYTGVDVFRWIDEGQPETVAAYRQWLQNIVMVIHNLKMIIDPQKIVIGGGVSRNPRLLKDLQEEYDKAAAMVEPFGMPHAELALCHYTSDANLVGALYNWKLHYE